MLQIESKNIGIGEFSYYKTKKLKQNNPKLNFCVKACLINAFRNDFFFAELSAQLFDVATDAKDY